MNAYCLTHPGLDLQTRFEGEVSQRGEHPIADNLGSGLSDSA